MPSPRRPLSSRLQGPDRLAPDRVERRGLAEDEAARGRRVAGIEAQAREALEEAADRGVGLQAREMHADADVGALPEGELVAGVLPADVEAIRVRKGIRVAVRAGDRERDELASLDRCVVEPDVGGRVP